MECVLYSVQEQVYLKRDQEGYYKSVEEKQNTKEEQIRPLLNVLNHLSYWYCRMYIIFERAQKDVLNMSLWSGLLMAHNLYFH